MRAPVMSLIGLLALSGAGSALDLTLPGGASLTREVVEEAASYRLPVGPYRDGDMPALDLEGRVVIQAWRLRAQATTALQLSAPLRRQLQEAGYELIYECGAQACGGFDFRYETRILPAPDMFVDLFDYRYLAARRAVETDDASYVSIIASRSGATGHVQITQILPEGSDPVEIGSGVAVDIPQPGADEPLAQSLVASGHIVLDDLSFETGSASLGEGPFQSLEALADFLKSDSGRRVALVGHTDSVGDLEANIQLSRRRAEAVLERLTSDHDVPRTQLEAEGMGYLAPVGSNLTSAGRQANRRVEAVLLNTE